MGLKLNVDKAYEIYLDEGGKTSFPDSLKKVLTMVKNDKNINKKEHLAFLLATAKIESDYSLERWESDYLCGSTGKKYIDKPCQKALDYYRSTDGKKNYYTLGTDKRGLPYFGRGLIQLTGKSNYETFGKKIGVDLVNNADLALKPENSYKIASEYMALKRSYYGNENAFDKVDKNDWPTARKIVKGSSSGWENLKNVYDFWMRVLNNPQVNAKPVSSTGNDSRNFFPSFLVGISLVAAYVLYRVYNNQSVKWNG